MKSITIQTDNEQDLLAIAKLAERLNATIVESVDLAEEPVVVYANEDENTSALSLDEFNERIDQSLHDIEEGRVVSSADLLDDLKSW